MGMTAAGSGGAYGPMGQGAQGPPPGYTYVPGQTPMHGPVLRKTSEVGGVYVSGPGYGAVGAPRLLKGATVNQSGRLVPPQPAGPPPAPPVPTGTPISVAPEAVPTDVNAIRQQFLASQGLQPAGANLVDLLAQQQAARFSPSIQAIREGFLTG